jgi:hypothetical protein
MPQVKCRFRRSEMTRAIKGVEAAGLGIARIDIDNDGRITLILGSPEESAEKRPNEWDEVIR